MNKPKQTEMKTTRKERRKKFDKWIDKSFISHEWKQGRIKKMRFYTAASNLGEDIAIKKPRIKCSICKKVSGSGVFKADNEWYCFEHESYAGIKNKDRRIEGMPQSKKHPDYDWKYQFKWQTKFIIRRTKCLLQSKVQTMKRLIKRKEKLVLK